MALSCGVQVAIAISLIALFFQVAGYVLPWWFVFGDVVYMGVWYFLYCPAGISATNCTVYTFTEVNNYNTNAGNIEGTIFYTLFQVVTSVSAGFCFFSCLILIICACGGVRSKGGYVVSCIFLLFSSLSSLVVVAFFIYLYVAIFLADASSTFTINAKNFPYALLAFALGCVFVFIAFLALAISLCTWRNYDSDDENSDDGQRFPMAGVDKRQTYNSGYDNPRYPTDNKYGYSDSRKPYPTQPSYGSKNYQQDYDSRNSGRSGDYGYSQRDNGYPYKQDNMYRPYSRKY